MSENSITHLPEGLFENNKELSRLDLHVNLLTAIPSQILRFKFIPVGLNVNVDLSYNRIRQINLNEEEMTAQLEDLDETPFITLRVDNNPISCDCELYNLLRHLEGRMGSSVQNSIKFIFYELKCKKSNGAEVLISRLSSKTFECPLATLSVTCPD